MKNLKEIVIDCNKNFFRFVNKYTTFEKLPKRYYKNIILNFAEIKLICTIGYLQCPNITQTAEMLGITKGAVSQKYEKLIRIKFIKKKRTFNNSKEVILELDKKGQYIYEEEKKIQKKILENFMNSVSIKELITFNMIINKMENCLDKAIKKYS